MNHDIPTEPPQINWFCISEQICMWNGYVLLHEFHSYGTIFARNAVAIATIFWQRIAWFCSFPDIYTLKSDLLKYLNLKCWMKKKERAQLRIRYYGLLYGAQPELLYRWATESKDDNVDIANILNNINRQI